MRINNDADFKAALAELDIHQQRRAAAAFVESVLHLCQDMRVSSAISMVKHPGVGESELASAYQAVNSVRVERFTQCGKEADWRSQAGHFVAKAALSCVRPADESPGNIAWEAAMSARMARTCESVAEGTGTDNHEAESQYRILYELLNS
jgi:hypothetical protein